MIFIFLYLPCWLSQSPLAYQSSSAHDALES